MAPAIVAFRARSTAAKAGGSVARVARFDTVSLLTDYGTVDEFAAFVRIVVSIAG